MPLNSLSEKKKKSWIYLSFNDIGQYKKNVKIYIGLLKEKENKTTTQLEMLIKCMYKWQNNQEYFIP